MMRDVKCLIYDLHFCRRFIYDKEASTCDL